MFIEQQVDELRREVAQLRNDFAKVMGILSVGVTPENLAGVMERAVAAVCVHWSVTKSQLLSDDRTKPIVLPRHAAIWLAYKIGLKHDAIALAMNRTRCLVMYALNTVNNQMETDPKYRAEMGVLLDGLKRDGANETSDTKAVAAPDSAAGAAVKKTPMQTRPAREGKAKP